MKTLTFDEPFGDNYTLKMAKQDSDRVLRPRRERQIRIAAFKEFGMTLVTIIGLVGWVGLGVQASV